MDRTIVVDEGAARAAETPSRWSAAAVLALFELPFNELLYRAHSVHRQHFDPNEVQLSTLLSVKTGGCPEDCGYCPQSARFNTGLANEELLPVEQVLAAARTARDNGATRFCMGAAWRGPKQRDLEQVIDMIRAVRDLGLETCATLGMLKEGQAEQLRAAGLDYYNHNIDTAADHYDAIVHTRTQQDRMDTLERVRAAGLHVCCGGIVGMGETREQRAHLIAQLAAMNPHPESVPINHLVAVPGTPLAQAPRLDPIEFVRTVACARITMPSARVRLSAGRSEMSQAVQALCFFAGANSIFHGEKLLTTGNPQAAADAELMAKLGLHPAAAEQPAPA